MESCNNAVDITRAVHDDDGASSSSSPTIHDPSMKTTETSGIGFHEEVLEDRKCFWRIDYGGGGGLELENKENSAHGLAPLQREKEDGLLIKEHKMYRPNYTSAQAGNHHDHVTPGTLIATDKDERDGMPSMESIFTVDATILEQKGLFHGKKKGYWLHPETVFHHRSTDHTDKGGSNSFKKLCHGQMLLQANLPTPEQGWVNLQSSEIPSGPPITEPIHSWEEYANARNLARSSVAPLLLTNVLTLYHMLFNVLHLPGRTPVHAESHRHTGFLVYVLGAEQELNHLPIFEELIYLIRGMDLELRFVSPAVKALMDKARKHFPESYLMTSGDYIMDKEGLDGSRLRISFELDDAHFYEMAGASSFFQPDAVVGLNAGISNDADWDRTILDLFWNRTPFCFSDATKHELRTVKDILIPKMMEAHFELRQQSGVAVIPRCPDIELSQNPFHGAIVQERGSCMMPTISNGYLLSYQGEKW